MFSQDKRSLFPAEKCLCVYGASLKSKSIFWLLWRESSLDSLKESLRTQVALDPDLAVFVRGDKNVKYDEIMKVVNAVRECKVQRMSLITIEE